VKRFATVAVGLSVLAMGVAWPVALGAQAPAKPPTGPDQSRISELVQYARATYDETQAAAQAPQRQTLEERALARPVLTLSVEQAVAMALENNIELSVERLNPTLQDMSIWQVKGAYRPTLGSTVNTNSNMPLPTSLLNGGTRVTNEVANFNASLAQALPWFGSSYTAAFNNSRTNTNSTFATLNPQYISQLTATLTQPLLRNFKIDATRQSLQTSIITREVSDLTLRARIVNTVANTRNAYWDLVYSIRAVAAAQQSVNLAEKLVEDNRIRVEVGTLAPMDIISAQAEAATRRQTLTQSEATRRTTELVLKRLVVGSTEDKLWKATIDPTDAVQVLPQNIELEAAVVKALGQRTDLVSSRKQLESNDISLRYLRNQMLPGLDLAATFGTRGLGGNQFIRDGNNGPIIGQIPGGWIDAMRTLSKFDYPNWTVGVTFSYPLGRSTQDVAYARAKIQYTQAQAQLRALELTVATEVTNAALQVESSLKRLDAARAARQLAEKRLENEQSKFDVGMQTNFFVVQAQRDLLDSQITELRASLDYRKALVDFERVQETSASGGGSVTAVSTSGGTTTTAR
jgi:outer membrane protein